jgi:DNA-binding CsgD family transcriptional regulator
MTAARRSTGSWRWSRMWRCWTSTCPSATGWTSSTKSCAATYHAGHPPQRARGERAHAPGDRRGAAGYLIKTADRDTICDAIAAVVRGETALAAEVQEALAEEIRVRSGSSAPLLSVREQEVLRLTADGCSAKEIAERLDISATTVRTYLSHAYEKLGVSDRAAAVAEAMRRGLLE